MNFIVKKRESTTRMQESRIELKTLLSRTEVLSSVGPASVEVCGCTLDSRQVRPGMAFFATPGQITDGRQFIEEAIQRGAVAVVSKQDEKLARGVTAVKVADVRQALAHAAAVFWDDPGLHLKTIGLTGTNGKTTTSFMIRSILEAAQWQPGMLGTIRYEIGGRHLPAHRTTPEAPDLQRYLNDMVQAGCQCAVMEVSSHALDQHRVHGMTFDAAVFTNLTQDHLDYHQNMEAYFEAKCKLFLELLRPDGAPIAVLPERNNWADRIRERLPPHVKVITWGMKEPSTVRAQPAVLRNGHAAFQIHSPWGREDFHLPMVGAYNLHNALAAISTAVGLGVELPVVKQGLENLQAVPGRLEAIQNEFGFNIFVDYAHTDGALTQVLTSLRQSTCGRIILVLGCGGNRDQGKRVLMGRVASELADVTILTSDNPRRENPEDIINQMEEGFSSASKYEKVLDRADAISRAISILKPKEDILLVAGKGHETVQEIGSTVVPFDDRMVVRRVLERMKQETD